MGYNVFMHLAAAKKSARPSEDSSAGGLKGGILSRPSVKIKASPAALLVESRTQQKSFLFLYEKTGFHLRRYDAS